MSKARKTNKSIFEKPVFDLPIKSEVNYFDAVKDSFDNFLRTLEEFSGEIEASIKPNMAIIAKQCESILGTIELFLKGFPGQAYTKLKECLDELNALDLLEIQQNLTSTEKGNLYRVRIDQSTQIDKNGIFHIPFNLREKVGTQRYSIPGLPCLYLADSLFVCWQEMDRPEFNSMHASRFDLSDSEFKFLNLNINTNEIRKRCFTKTKEKFVPHLTKYISYWPLLAACSFIVRKPTELFKPEYIIPQLVLQWIVDAKGVDGIKYKSNRIKAGTNNIGSFTNVVIPVKMLESTGFCRALSKKIKFTNPISWSLLDVSDPNRDFLKRESGDTKTEALRRASFIEVVDGESTIYISSKFGILEEKLKTLPSTLLV